MTGLSSFKLCRGKSNKVSDLNMDRVDKLKEDRDVIAEKNRVDGLTANTMTDDEILRISHLRKVFGNGRVAVKDLSVSIVKGEVCIRFFDCRNFKTSPVKVYQIN